uniref:Uncharacterized protein n=1 Tax=Plectus sambesii TaxID=2011161 RepID=A0A914WYB4_9BILA
MKIALSLVLCFSLSVYATNKCLMNAEALELSKIYKTSTSASKSAEFIHLATALHHLSVTDDSTGEALNCSQHLWRALGQSLIREDQTIDKLKKSISSWHDVSQVRQILSKCQNADVAHRRFQNAFVTTNHYRLTWLELQNACVTYNPDMALVTLINRMRGDEMSGRLELVRNALFSSRYDHAKYKQFADYMMGEATRCAVLAITCLSIRYANATTPELAVFSMDNKQRLQEINETLEHGFESLREEFFEQQLDEDLREQQNLGIDSNLDIFEETDAMFNFLSNKYPFRGWAAIRFDSNDQWPADHAIWGSNDRYKKLLNYGEH